MDAIIKAENLIIIQKGVAHTNGAISCYVWKNTNKRLLINDSTGEVHDIYKCDPGVKGIENHLQHMADDNPNISLSQKEVIRALLTGPYFVPFSYEGEWDYIYSKSKIELVNLLLDGRWGFELTAAYIEDDIYILIISFDQPIIVPNLSENRYMKDQRQEAKSIEIYLTYSVLLQLYKVGIEQGSSYWKNHIKSEDK